MIIPFIEMIPDIHGLQISYYAYVVDVSHGIGTPRNVNGTCGVSVEGNGNPWPFADNTAYTRRYV